MYMSDRSSYKIQPLQNYAAPITTAMRLRKNMCMCMCINMCTSICICMSRCICKCVVMSICIYICICMNMCMYMSVKLYLGEYDCLLLLVLLLRD
jgi:hypothetical protein